VLIHVLKSKIHRATVTGAELEYEGSLAVDPELIEAAGMIVGEKVQVLNLSNGARFETYLIQGTRGEMCLNGPAARLGQRGDRVIVIAYALLTLDEAAAFKPNVVFVDDANRLRPKS
jgi:aspartate 1-decarboxylase